MNRNPNSFKLYEIHRGYDPMTIGYSYNLGEGSYPGVAYSHTLGELDIPKLLFSPMRALGEAETQAETLGDLTEGQVKAVIWGIMLAGALVGGYHAHKKYGDVGSVLAWGAAGASFPIPTALVAAATGYGKR